MASMLRPQTPQVGLPALVIRQAGDRAEGRVVAQACMLRDIGQVRAELGELTRYAAELRAGAVPEGSVEFVRAAMAAAGIIEPAPMSYPGTLEPWMRRRVDRMPLERVRGTVFIKPETTKLFTGFVWREGVEDQAYDEHDREQLERLRALAPDTMVWVAEPVRFQCEWRYYVLDGEVLGAARYDQDGADDAPVPDALVLSDAVRAMTGATEAPVAYALDLGVLEGGETAVVEVNDAWAIGHYGRGGPGPVDYLRFLAARWSQMRLASANPSPSPRRMRP